MEALWHDVRYGARQLLRSSGFTAERLGNDLRFRRVRQYFPGSGYIALGLAAALAGSGKE
jgi:hypothetical protein